MTKTTSVLVSLAFEIRREGTLEVAVEIPNDIVKEGEEAITNWVMEHADDYPNVIKITDESKDTFLATYAGENGNIDSEEFEVTEVLLAEDY